MPISPVLPCHTLAAKLSTRAGGSSTAVRGRAPVTGQSGAGMVHMYLSSGAKRSVNDWQRVELALPPALVAGAQRPEPGRASGTSAGREAHPDGNHGDNNICPGRRS